MRTPLQKLNYAILFYLLFLSYVAHAQSEIWGMTQWGGDGAGVIFKTDLNGENQEVLYKFPGLEGGTGPNSYRLCPASNGKFYGTTQGGGVKNGGVIYEFDQSTNTYTKLYDFGFVSPGGSNPYSGVVAASNGKLYGLTKNGGLNSKGTIYEFDLSTKTYTKLYDFTDAGGYPSIDDGEMIQASNGKLYGATSAGGTAWGVVFEFNPSGNVYKKLYTFPQGHYSKGLTELPNGKLYGISAQGGSNWAGIVFTIDISTGNFVTAYDFVNSTVKLPRCGLVLAANSKLYGTASSGGTNNKGGLFSFDPADNTCTVLYNFDGTASASSQGMVQAANGRLYGMTSSLGNDGNGTVFEYNLSDNKYTVLYDFDGINGRNPASVLVQDASGKLYSTSVYGGYNDNAGLIFEFNLTGNKYTPVYKFGGTLNGAYPIGGVTQGNDGKVYGMTQSGGANDLGVIFTMDPVQHIFTKLHDFELPNGNSPGGNLVKGADGKLYGLARGGTNGKGMIFQLDPATQAYTKRYEFDGSNGAYPTYDGLVSASNGKLYGITTSGGASDKGVIFEFDPTAVVCTKRYDFTGASGEGVDGTLIQAANGKLYGTTYTGGANDVGVIFEFNPAGYAYVKLYDFVDASGSGPEGTLAQDANGKLYGTTSNGGATSAGVFFEFDATTKTYTKLRDKGADGDLIEVSAGKILGMTGTGIFEYDVTGKTFTDKVAFSGANGAGWLNLYIYNPLSLVNPNLLVTGVEESNFGHSLTLYPNPTTGKLTVDLEKNYNNVSVSICDITGKVISKTMRTSTNQLNLEIEGKPGFYIVEIYTREGNSAKFKIVKN